MRPTPPPRAPWLTLVVPLALLACSDPPLPPTARGDASLDRGSPPDVSFDVAPLDASAPDAPDDLLAVDVPPASDDAPVACDANAHCEPDERCVSGRCAPVPECEGPADCQVFGLVCDRARGRCVPCAHAEECPMGSRCVEGQCRSAACGAAEVLFLVDRSGSMSLPAGDGRTRWEALVAAVRAVLPTLDPSLHMGLLVFPDPDGCAVPSRPQVPVAQPSASAIALALAARQPPSMAATPTLAAMMAAEVYLRANPSPRRRFVVLATDGAPTCNATVTQVVDAIRRVRANLGADTFVLGIPGLDRALYSSLNQMALAGGQPRVGAVNFYEASSTATLEAALRAIALAAGACFG